MEKVSISKIADFIGGKLIGADGYITNITTDSRVCEEGTMFIGIKGERVDGNDFASDFLKNGGTCAVAEKSVEIPDGKSAIYVEDTRKSIRDIAEYYRTLLDTDVIAVTGSVGKTSTKDMLSSVISQGFKTLATQGNFNNEIGVPLTVFRLDSSHEKAVIEMGMSNLGEISRLTRIAKPDIAVITNIGTAHIGNLGSRENILKAKLEVLECLSADGLAVFNGDDDMLWSVRDAVKNKITYFGIENEDSDYVAYDVKTDGTGSSFSVNIDGKECTFRINIAGRHHIYNAMSAIVCGLHFGMGTEQIAEGISNFTPAGMRQNIVDIGDVKLIEDCYNASTVSMKASLEMLKSICGKSRSIAVLGDILEQGVFAEKMHREVGKYVAEYNIDTLVTVGNDSRYIADEARKNGVKNVFEFDDNKSASEFLANYISIKDVVLFKASRGMRFEEISQSLQEVLKG